uniref:Uncharacterized protein n=1 Tax=viral metagenome TaxID=1070528 RepID=A0A6C0KPY3_9ZZZZ
MAHAFSIIPAKPTFGTLRQNLYQSDIINRKKAEIIFCNSKSYCGKLLVSKNYADRILFDKGQISVNNIKCLLAKKRFLIPVNKSNLVIGQYSKLDLTPVCSVKNSSEKNIAVTCLENTYLNCSSVPIDPNSKIPFYIDKIIDPCGRLFGNTQCGELNYTSYMILNPPDNNIII